MIAIVDYNAGNLTSVKRALDFLGIPCEITNNARTIADAQRILFPGVGHARTAMETIRERGIDEGLREAREKGTPILGICLGTQIILEHSQEGDTPCLGLIEGECIRMQPGESRLKIPHMGWDSISLERTHPVLDGIRTGDEFYFVHSFCPSVSNRRAIVATCDYGLTFPAAIGDGCIIATQFHPEKSGPAGLALLSRFAQWDGTC